MFRILPLLSAIGWLAFVPSHLRSAPKPAPVKVGFITNNPAPFWLMVEKGARKAAKEFVAELDFRRPPNGTAREQLELLEGMLGQDLDSITVVPNDPLNQEPDLKQAAAKLPLVIVDNDAPKSGRRIFIGTDNVAAGRMVGKLVKEAMPKGGKVAFFVGLLEPLNARQRYQGALDALGIPEGKTTSKDGKYTLVRDRPYTDEVSLAKSTRQAEAALLRVGDPENLCLVGLWAYNPPAILRAVKAANRLGKVKIVGFDEDLQTLKGIEDGHIYATVVQNPYQFGYQAVRYMSALARGEKLRIPKNGMKSIPSRIVTKTGGKERAKASVFAARVKELLGQDP